jgi:hypothetical protein
MTGILDTHGSTDFPTHDFWKGSTAMTISLMDFLYYVAGPQVANMLISQDLSITVSEAERVRLKSIKHGIYLHDGNEEIDDIVMQISAPKRVRTTLCPHSTC